MTLTPNGFGSLFGTSAYQAGDLYYWNGNLSVPNGLNVAGLWFDTAPWFGTPGGRSTSPAAPGPSSMRAQASQLPVDDLSDVELFPGAIARDFTIFRCGKDVPTTTSG